MKLVLDAPVQFGDVRLAPTVELAGLAELAALRDIDERAAAIRRIAEAVRAEDDARRHLAALRAGEVDASRLPRRR